MSVQHRIEIEPVRYAVTGGQPCGVYEVMRDGFFPPEDWNGLDAPDFIATGSVSGPINTDMAIATSLRLGAYA